MKWLALVDDPVVGGSKYSDIATTPPTEVWPSSGFTFFPVEEATPDQGYSGSDGNDEVRTGRGRSKTRPTRAAPTLNFTLAAYPSLVRFLARRAWGGPITSSGTAPAPVTSKVAGAASGANLQPFFAFVLRDGQLDRMSGLWISSFQLQTGDGSDDAKIVIQARALYHSAIATPGGLPNATFSTEEAYTALTLSLLVGNSATPISCPAGADITVSNELVTDPVAVYCANEQIRSKVVSNKYVRRQFPYRNKIGDQVTSGELRFGTERPDMEALLADGTVDKLVLRLTGDPLGTTPAADDVMRIVLPGYQLTEGGATALSKADPRSTYQFAGLADPASGELPYVEFVGASALV